MDNSFIPFGILIIFLGFILIFIGPMMNANSKDTKVAVGGFIGFIPFGFTNDKKLLWILVAPMAFALVFFSIINFASQSRMK